MWPGVYDEEKTRVALKRTIKELLVLPEYRKMGIGSRLLSLAKDNTPTLLYFGAQPGVEQFYEKNGCKKSLQSYVWESPD